jgi:hypothetical protein
VKHSAKAAARIAREQDKAARRGSGALASAPPAARPESAARSASASSSSLAAGSASASSSLAAGSASASSSNPVPRQRLAQLPYAIVLAATAAGLGLMWGGGHAVSRGTLVLAGALLAGSLARLVLPDGKVGLLRSRRRLVDVALLTALGVGLLIAGLIVRIPG